MLQITAIGRLYTLGAWELNLPWTCSCNPVYFQENHKMPPLYHCSTARCKLCIQRTSVDKFLQYITQLQKYIYPFREILNKCIIIQHQAHSKKNNYFITASSSSQSLAATVPARSIENFSKDSRSRKKVGVRHKTTCPSFAKILCLC